MPLIASGETSEESGAARALALATVVAVAIAMGMQPVRSPDVWHHAACGRLVARTGGPAHADPFSHTARGRPWIQYEWLSQLVIYEAYAHLGPAGWMLLRIASLALAAGLLWYAATMRAGPWAAAGAVILALCGMSERFFTRPEIFSWILFAALMISVEFVRNGRRIFVPVCAAIVALWVNLHGAWIAGLAWIGLQCAGDTLARAIGRTTGRSGTLRFLWLSLGLGLVATLVNPYGPRIWEVPFALSRSAEVASRIAEWQRPTLAWLLDPRHVGAAVLLGALVSAPLAPTAADWMTLLFFGALSLTAVRHLALAFLVVAPILAHEFAAIGRETRRLGRVGVACVPAAAVICVVVALGGPRLPRAGFGLAHDRFPIGAARALERFHLEGNLFNSYEFGNYLIFARHPWNPVFMDGRVDMYGGEILALYDRLRAAAPGWEKSLADRGVELCLLATNRRTDAPLLRALHESPGWGLVYWDDISALYVARRRLRSEALAGLHIYGVRPDSPHPPMPDADAAARALRDYTAKVEEDPHCLLARWGRGECLRKLGRPDEAVAEYRAAAALAEEKGNPQPVLLLTLGASLLETGHPVEAERYLRRALRTAGRAGPNSDEVRLKALWNVSVALERQGKYPAAAAAMRRYLHLSDSPEARERLASLEEKRKAPR